MPKTDIKLYSTDAATGAKQTTTISYVNPNNPSSVMKSFAQQLNNLTTNTYTSTDKVTTSNLDTEGDDKQFRNLAISGASRGATATITFTTSTSETQKPTPFTCYVYQNGGQLQATYVSPTAAESTDPTIAKYTFTCPNTAADIFVGISTKTEFYADFVKAIIS